MKIEKFINPDKQMSKIGRYHWSVSRLFELSKNLEVLDIPLNYLNVYHIYNELTLREMVMHINAVNNADMSYPIILDEDGEIMDGRHRIMKAMINESKNIKAVRFDENQPPCRIDDD